MKAIPFVDLKARHRAVAEDTLRRVQSVLDSGQYIGGPMVAEVESLAAQAMGRDAAVGVASGTDALILALQVVGVHPGDEVLVPAVSFFATAGAVLALDAVPVVVDVDEAGLMDPDAAREAVGARTRAVIPVHLFGSTASRPDVDLPVVDDAAQAMGAGPSASIGELTALSVYPTKVWGAAGDGGFVVGDTSMVHAVRQLGTHHRTPQGFTRTQGWAGRNSRLDALQAAVLLAQHQTLRARIERRRHLAARYDDLLPASIRPLPRSPHSTVAQYVVRVSDRDRAEALLDAAGIGHARYYERPLSHEPALSHCRRTPTPIADAWCREVLALPMRASLGDHEVDRICTTLAAL